MNSEGILMCLRPFRTVPSEFNNYSLTLLRNVLWIRNRYIHSLRESSYIINIEARRPDEDLTVNVYGMDGEVVGSYHFLPQQGICFVSIAYSDFEYDGRKRIIRDHQRDIQIIKKKFGL